MSTLRTDNLQTTDSSQSIPVADLASINQRTISGQVEIDVSGGSDVTVSASDAVYGIIRLTGEITDDIALIVPDTARLYTIINNASGSHTITVRTENGAGTNIERADGIISLRSDGVDVVKASSVTDNVKWGSTALTRTAIRASINTGWGKHSLYDSESNTTFVTYAGRGMAPYIVSVNHSTNRVSDPVRIAGYPIVKNDDHGVPVIAMDTSGFLHVIYGTHNTDFYHAKSSQPRDISAWDASNTNIEGTYAALVCHEGSGDLFAPFRAGTGHGSVYPAHEFMGLLTSSNAGASWADAGPIVDLTGHPDSEADIYNVHCENIGSNIGIAFQIATGTGHDDVRKNLYYIEYDPSDGTVYSVNGDSFGSTIDWADMDGNGDVEVSVGDLHSGAILSPINGKPFITFVIYNSVDDNFGHHIAKFNEGAGLWDVISIGSTVNWAGSRGVARYYGDGVIRAFVPEGRADESSVSFGDSSSRNWYAMGADLSVYKSDDMGGSFQKERVIITKEQMPTQGVGFVEVPRDSSDECPIIYSGALGDNTAWVVPLYFANNLDADYKSEEAVNRLAKSPYPTEQRISEDTFDPIILTTSPSATFETVDLSGIVPSNCSQVYISVSFNGSDSIDQATRGESLFEVREKEGGRNRDFACWLRATSIQIDHNVFFAWVPVSDDGEIEYRVDDGADLFGSGAELNVRLAGFKTQ